MGGAGLKGARQWHALYAIQALDQQLIGTLLDLLRHVGVGRPTFWGIVLKAAITRGIV